MAIKSLFKNKPTVMAENTDPKDSKKPEEKPKTPEAKKQEIPKPVNEELGNDPSVKNELKKPEKKEKAKKEKKRKPIFLIILLSLCILGLGLSGTMILQEMEKVKQKDSEIATLKDEKTQLEEEIATHLAELKSVKAENAEMQAEINAKIAEIEQLQADLEKEKRSGNAAQLANYKAKYRKMKANNDELLAKIAQLETDNKTLEGQKEKLNKDLNVAYSLNQELGNENKFLTEKVDLGSKLSAFEIRSFGIQMKGGGTKEKITDKSKKVKKIKVSYKVGKNLLANNEIKTAYIRILSPDNVVLAQGIDESNTFDFNGEKLVFSSKQEFQYENSEKELGLYFVNSQSFTSGRYQVEVYIDGAKVGESNFMLR